MRSFLIIKIICYINYACIPLKAFSKYNILTHDCKRSTFNLNLSFHDISFQSSDSDTKNMKHSTARRKFLIAVLSTTTTTANAIDNPLNLKGTFWETGQIYQKSNTPQPSDESDFLSILENTVDALHSPTLLNSITEGKYGQASRLLRGNLISESKIRIAANALIDLLPEDDDAIFKSDESFRMFLRYLDALDAEVEVASRSFRGDPRLDILTRLGEVEDALKVFLKNVRGGLVSQE